MLIFPIWRYQKTNVPGIAKVEVAEDEKNREAKREPVVS
jgi:hypothetical protein